MALQELMTSVNYLPREEDPGPMEERILNHHNARIVRYEERNGVPIRGILAGRVIVKYFGTSSQLEIVIGQMHHFCEIHRENWSRSKRRYLRVERVFARNLFNVLYAVKINVTNRQVTKPPIDRHTFDKLVVCYNFEPFHKYWSPRRKSTAQQYMNIIEFFYNIHHETQEQMYQRIKANDDIYCPHL